MRGGRIYKRRGFLPWFSSPSSTKIPRKNYRSQTCPIPKTPGLKNSYSIDKKPQTISIYRKVYQRMSFKSPGSCKVTHILPTRCTPNKRLSSPSPSPPLPSLRLCPPTSTPVKTASHAKPLAAHPTPVTSPSLSTSSAAGVGSAPRQTATPAIAPHS